MENEHREIGEPSNELDLKEVPDWHRNPGSALWEFGKPIQAVTLERSPEKVEVDDQVAGLRKHIEVHSTPSFFSGPLANVERITLDENGITIDTSETDFFTYLASAYANRDHVGQNPIRPLAVQATIFSPDQERMVIERRPATLADNPNKLSVFGGAIKPQDSPSDSIIAILNRKLELDLQPDQVKPSGLVRENIDNIYCLTYSVTLNEQQFVKGQSRATAANRSGERMFYQIKTDDTRKSIEQLFGGKRPIPEWDPNAYFNILYALAAEKKRTPDQVRQLVQQMQEYIAQHPMEYTFPIEKFIPSEAKDL